MHSRWIKIAAILLAGALAACGKPKPVPVTHAAAQAQGQAVIVYGGGFLTSLLGGTPDRRQGGVSISAIAGAGDRFVQISAPMGEFRVRTVSAGQYGIHMADFGNQTWRAPGANANFVFEGAPVALTLRAGDVVYLGDVDYEARPDPEARTLISVVTPQSWFLDYKDRSEAARAWLARTRPELAPKLQVRLLRNLPSKFKG